MRAPARTASLSPARHCPRDGQAWRACVYSIRESREESAFFRDGLDNGLRRIRRLPSFLRRFSRVGGSGWVETWVEASSSPEGLFPPPSPPRGLCVVVGEVVAVTVTAVTVTVTVEAKERAEPATERWFEEVLGGNEPIDSKYSFAHSHYAPVPVSGQGQASERVYSICESCEN